ncbi:TetR/AcrR family transcriptional regulator C-terminal domain-containing protein [Actinoplanes sp. NPDC023714]|uniref:TetR/AcrR family transcriptional regulator n=1 Tax=Actinoplanes sp. NPDC023714 TaxID=3154322 RepID=UPI0033CA17FF
MAGRAALSRERVLAAAVAIADTEGLKALTMRRLAADLGVEAMSLYHHLPSKDALLDGIVEAVIAEVRAEVPARSGEADWRTDIRGRFLTARRVMLRHPWAPGLLTSRKAIPPIVYGYYDEIVGTLLAGGFSYRLAHRALHAFGSITLGFAQEMFSPGDTAAADDDLTEIAAFVPHIAAMVESEIHAAGDPTLGWCDSQTEFEFTLDLLLNGLDDLRVRSGETPG